MTPIDTDVATAASRPPSSADSPRPPSVASGATPRSGLGLVVAGAVAGAAVLGGLAWALAGGPGGGDGAALPTVVVTAHHSRFVPERIAVEAGTTVRFVLHNADPISHELIMGPAEVHERHEKGTEAEHGDVPGEVSVGPGGEASTTYTFTEPGVVAFGCHLPGHWDYGMHGEIEVR